jgi:hypothetical protein
MGLTASWYAIRGYPRDDLLAKFDLVETGGIAFLGEAPLFFAELSNGWTVVCARDFSRFDVARAGELFPNSDVVACQMMQSGVRAEVRGLVCGQQAWRVAHRVRTEDLKVEVEGSLPQAYEAIAAERNRRQVRSRKKNVDFLVEIPLDLAACVVGFHADQGCAPIDTIFKVVEERLSGKKGEQQRQRIIVETGLTSGVRQTLYARAADLGFGPIEAHADLHRFYGFGAVNVLVRDRPDHLEIIELFWGVAQGRPYVEVRFVARGKVRPRLARPGVAAFPRPKETLRTMLFGLPKIEPATAIAAAILTGCTLLDAVDAYFSSGAAVPPLQAPVYFNYIEA